VEQILFDSDFILIAVLGLPLLSFLINGVLIRPILGTRSPISGFITVGSITLAFIFSLASLFHVIINGEVVFPQQTWLSFGYFQVEFGVLLDQLTSIMLVVVTGVSLIVQVYGMAYMKSDRSYVRYYAYMSLFTASMIGLVISRNLIQLFIFWELVGVSSYLLIGFWMNRPSAAEAAKKAFIMTRFGDFGFLLGIIYLASQNPAWLDIPTIYHAIDGGNVSATVATLVSLGFLAGAVGKSAQFPLHSWLPDAMEGPTSVSALIHSATMVTAGVFLIARMFPVFEQSSNVLLLVSLIGGFTIILAASMGFVASDIKRVLAYSTVSQLGYMMLALGIGAYVPAVFHLFTHAFFKAALFLGAGSVHHASGTFNMRYMGGLKKIMPYTYWSMLIASLSLAGIFPLSGFWSKDEILAHFFHDLSFFSIEFVLVFLAIVGAMMTAFYMFRVIFLVFHGEFRGGGKKEKEDLKDNGFNVPETLETPHLAESPKVMVIPVIFLAVMAVIIGFVVNPPIDLLFVSKHWFAHFIGLENQLVFYNDQSAIHAGSKPEFNFVVAIVSTLMAVIGIGLATLIYLKRYIVLPNNSVVLRKVRFLLEKKYFIDFLYEEKLVRQNFYNRFSKIVEFFDLKWIDNINILIGKFTIRVGTFLSSGQIGQLQVYTGTMILGLIILVAGLILWN
jgi:NADH-quinone oxidoreductase subunit L